VSKKEVQTDLWVYEMLKQAAIPFDAQGSSVKEISEALKTASKKGTGNTGFPEYTCVVKDYLLVIEDKADLSKHVKRDDSSNISKEITAITDYAVNGAVFYGKHLAEHTSYKKVIAIGISGNQKKHLISPVYIDETEYYRELPVLESLISFNEANIDEYYTREILKEETRFEKETADILKDARILHEALRNYGTLLDTQKPLIVSGILLALRESEYKNFSIRDLTGDLIKTDGQKIYDAINANLKRANVAPEVKKDKILSQFSFIQDNVKLNEIDNQLKKTPLKYFAEYLDKTIYQSIRYTNSAEDYIGRFYGEFMSYSGGDGQTLGIILTPKHITELFCDLANLNSSDVVFDPCCGTAGFLIAALPNMLKHAENEAQKKHIRQKQLHGIELQPNMFTIATTNMILRGDGKSNLINDDFLKQNATKLQLKQATVGMMNPPYSQGSKQNPHLYELAFVEHLLDSLVTGARCIVIVPQSSMTGKTKEEKSIKKNILKHHTLEGVITLNKDTFYGVGVMPCIAIFTAGEPHDAEKLCKFINFENDGYKIAPHIGLIETESAKDKKQHLLDVWFDCMEAETKFCVKTTIEATDEWLHSFYYFNDEIPCEEAFIKTIGDYLTFEFSMVMQGREYLFQEDAHAKIK
jgi:type I restriction-modification system methyltransferase subunit